ncbi:hypothetical protein [Endozoicomonas lisbonensis]|uniref:Uncharacterized protein n=1 Tax=Endozoicomonas lisbonensis TaxID=3120522 RepID=A0ABV2SM27_9GAMM
MITSLQKAIRSVRATLAAMLLPVPQDMKKALQPVPIPVEQTRNRQLSGKQHRHQRGYRF